MVGKFYYIDPGTGGLLINNLWQFLAMIIGVFVGFFFVIFKSIKKVISKLWQSIKNLS